MGREKREVGIKNKEGLKVRQEVLERIRLLPLHYLIILYQLYCLTTAMYPGFHGYCGKTIGPSKVPIVAQVWFSCYTRMMRLARSPDLTVHGPALTGASFASTSEV